MLQFVKKRWVYHVLIWLFVYLTFLGMDWMEERSRGEDVVSILVDTLSIFPVAIYIVYINFFAKEYFFDKRKYGLYFLVLLFILISGACFHEVLDHFFFTGQDRLLQNILNTVAIIPISLGLQYFKRGIINQYQLQELKAKTAETELNALKAQINPHFLFNTLNNIYGMNQIDSERASEMIMGLSDVMRYHLDFSKRNMVRLDDEIQLLNSYIQLEELRLNENCDLKVNFEKAEKPAFISPLLLLPFVENAFKHGTHPTKASFVHVELATTATQINFQIKNSIINNRTVIKTNIGLENTKRRLELIYPKKHELSIEKTEGDYSVKLTIDL